MNRLIFVLSAVAIFHGHHAYGLELQQCKLADSPCQQTLFQNVAGTYASTGIKEIGIEPIDPFVLKKLKMEVDSLLIELVEGECLNIGKTCKLLRYENDVKNFRRIIEVVCDRIVIQGKYLLSTKSSFKKLFADVSGCGNGSLVLEDWYFKFNYTFGFEKRDDGNIYTRAHFDEGSWISKVRRNATFQADNIMLNGYDVTKNVLHYVNKYWDFVLRHTSFGKQFHEISIFNYEFIYDTFFNSVPATNIYSDDLEPYVKKNLTC